MGDSANLASERLRKAIERNRRKQQLSQTQRTSIPPTSQSTQRTLVTRPEDIEFIPEILRHKTIPKTRALVPIKKQIVTAKKSHIWRDLLVKGAWIFCGILLVRLFFSGGGILDFYQGLHLLENRQYEYARINAENQELIYEIEQIKNDVSMQKKIVREHLGFIGDDEYLILFASENISQEK